MCVVALQIASAAFSMYSQISQGNAAARAASVNAENTRRIGEYNAKVAETNAEIQHRAANDALNRGAEDAAKIRQNVQKLNALSRAGQGSTGFAVDSGNFGVVTDQNAQFGELDAMTAMENARREQQGYLTNESDLLAQATNQRVGAAAQATNIMQQGNAAKRAGIMGAIGTGLQAGYTIGQSLPTKSTGGFVDNAPYMGSDGLMRYPRTYNRSGINVNFNTRG